MKYKIYGESLPNIPWEERKEGDDDVVWRSGHNPIVKRNVLPNSASALNSAVISYNGKFAGVFRIDNKNLVMELHRGFSDDGIHWDIDPKPIEFIGKDGNKFAVRGYDPRVVKIEDTYYIIYCNCYNGPTVAIASTKDFEDFYDIGNAFLPFNRNGVLFPEKIDDKYGLLSRPSDNGHTPFGDIFYSESSDLEYWGKHREVMKVSDGGVSGWQSLKIGAGPIPIKTSEGWLLIYHGVCRSCSGYVYSAGAALLDSNEPWKVKNRTKAMILTPSEIYEFTGIVPNVVFPCAALCDADTGRLTIYYGAGDSVICMAHTTVDMLIDYIKENSF